MTKQQVIRGAVSLIRKIAQERGLEVVEKGEGHAFDGGAWDGIFIDNSHIPTFMAKSEGYCIKLRPFWSSPEIDVHRESASGEESLIFNFSDYVKNPVSGKYEHTDNFQVHEVRVDARWNYRECIKEVYKMIDYVEEAGK